MSTTNLGTIPTHSGSIIGWSDASGHSLFIAMSNMSMPATKSGITLPQPGSTSGRSHISRSALYRQWFALIWSGPVYMSANRATYGPNPNGNLISMLNQLAPSFIASRNHASNAIAWALLNTQLT